MPYINQQSRDVLQPILDAYRIATINYNPSIGDLNYVITKICDRYILDKGISYTTFNEVVGALECLKQELYRKVICPYEDKKENENGGVYDSTL